MEILKQQKDKYLSLADLYEYYSKDVFKYSFSILKDSDEAKDAVQEVFLRHALSEDSFKGNCSQKTWLLIIARNYCFNRIKKKGYNNDSIDNYINPTWQIGGISCVKTTT